MLIKSIYNIIDEIIFLVETILHDEMILHDDDEILVFSVTKFLFR